MLEGDKLYSRFYFLGMFRSRNFCLEPTLLVFSDMSGSKIHILILINVLIATARAAAMEKNIPSSPDK